MKKEHLEAAQKIIDKAPESLRAVVVIAMDFEGNVTTHHAGTDGDLLVMSEMSAMASKLKMMGLISGPGNPNQSGAV